MVGEGALHGHSVYLRACFCQFVGGPDAAANRRANQRHCARFTRMPPTLPVDWLTTYSIILGFGAVVGEVLPAAVRRWYG